MKLLSLITILCFAQNSFAGDLCTTNHQYKSKGWRISTPENFDQVYSQLKQDIQEGLEDGSYVRDLEGTLVTSQTHDSTRIYMKTLSWDNLSTPTTQMYGDFAIFSNQLNPNEVLEIRWYKNGIKHMAINKKYMKCASLGSPRATNVIF